LDHRYSIICSAFVNPSSGKGLVKITIMSDLRGGGVWESKASLKEPFSAPVSGYAADWSGEKEILGGTTTLQTSHLAGDCVVSVAMQGLCESLRSC
jgi:hypothetical protein